MPRGRHKDRGYHQRGYKLGGRIPSEDLCPYCFSFGCNSGAMSPLFQAKISERRRKGLCPCCGQPKAHCKCKSSENIAPGVHTIRTHNNKKLRAAKMAVKRREAAYRAWMKYEDTLVELLGEDVYSDASYDLHFHRVPKFPWPQLSKSLRENGLDPELFRAGWENDTHTRSH